LLQNASEKLINIVRTIDTVARLGGDEFLLIAEDIKHEDQAAILAERIIRDFKMPFVLGDHSFRVETSIGIAIFPDDGTDPGTLIRNADTAMYRAKEEGRHTYRHFTQALNDRVAKRLRTENELRAALEESDLDVFYQAKYDLSKKCIIGMEGLARWNHSGELIPPDEFVPLAEETGMIVQLDHLMFKKGCRDLADFLKVSNNPLVLSLNCSAQVLHDKKLPSTIMNLITEFALKPENIQIEITETELMKNYSLCLGVIEELASYGITIALDDFGTGYSSLAQLSSLPISTLKIDKEFIAKLDDGEANRNIVETIIVMADKLGIEVIAEGVENEKQIEFLESIGCNLIQGYLISKPLPYAQFIGMVINEPPFFPDRSVV
ncbi:MAG TPA: bifunctional diguanylate cyclase/phosphodiesterase, partial [Spirochaetota bacterium]